MIGLSNSLGLLEAEVLEGYGLDLVARLALALAALFILSVLVLDNLGQDLRLNAVDELSLDRLLHDVRLKTLVSLLVGLLSVLADNSLVKSVDVLLGFVCQWLHVDLRHLGSLDNHTSAGV